MPNLMNRKMLQEYEKDFSSLKGAIFVRFEKHTTAQDHQLRRTLRKEKATYQVVKNRIARRALAARVNAATDLLKGPTAVIFGDIETTISAAKALDKARRANAIPGIEVRGGFLEGSVLTPAQVRALSAMPGRKELLGMIVGAAVAPASNVPGLVNSALATPARLVAALIEKRQAQEGAPAA